MLLLSSYDPGEPGEGTSVDYGERLHYTSFLLTMAVLFWTTVAIKFIQENRKAILKNPGGKNARKNTLKHSRFVLTAWDFSIPTEQEIENRKYSLGEGLFGLAFEDVVEALQRTRSMKTIVIRRLKQTAGFLVFFAALAGSVSCIVYASTQVRPPSVKHSIVHRSHCVCSHALLLCFRAGRKRCCGRVCGEFNCPCPLCFPWALILSGARDGCCVQCSDSESCAVFFEPP